MIFLIPLVAFRRRSLNKVCSCFPFPFQLLFCHLTALHFLAHFHFCSLLPCFLVPPPLPPFPCLSCCQVIQKKEEGGGWFVGKVWRAGRHDLDVVVSIIIVVSLRWRRKALAPRFCVLHKWDEYNGTHPRSIYCTSRLVLTKVGNSCLPKKKYSSRPAMFHTLPFNYCSYKKKRTGFLDVCNHERL